MARKKTKTTKRKSRKQHKKKKHINTSAFFMILISILLAAAIYYFYQYELEKRKPKIVPQQKETHLPAKTTKQEEQEPAKNKDTNAKQKSAGAAKAPLKSKPNGNVQSQRTKAPSIPQIIDYTDLEYPVSYSSQPEQIIFHTGHTVSYNKNWKIPNWVSYELTIDETMGSEKRHDKFMCDPHVTTGSATLADYRNSGYDRGHMVPAADMKWSTSAMKESFYLSNICPQHKNLNQKRWKDLENKVREWAIADSAIIVICGPIVNEAPKCIGSNKVTVPHGFFKVVLSPYKKTPQGIGFIFDNEHCSQPLRSHIVTIDSVESLTKLDFFSPLPDDIEDLLEAYVDTTYWGL